MGERSTNPRVGSGAQIPCPIEGGHMQTKFHISHHREQPGWFWDHDFPDRKHFGILTDLHRLQSDCFEARIYHPYERYMTFQCFVPWYPEIQLESACWPKDIIVYVQEDLS
jgi:hypothetical protein